MERIEIEFQEVLPMILSKLEQLKKDMNICEDVYIEHCFFNVIGSAKYDSKNIIGDLTLTTIALVGKKSYRIYFFALKPILWGTKYQNLFDGVKKMDS